MLVKPHEAASTATGTACPRSIEGFILVRRAFLDVAVYSMPVRPPKACSFPFEAHRTGIEKHRIHQKLPPKAPLPFTRSQARGQGPPFI